MIENGSIKFTGWPAMTLIAHVLWGYLFNVFTGFSFTGLRISVLVLGAVGAVVSFLIFNKISEGNTKTEAFLDALALALNPLYFSLSFTYMTDVPFLAFLSIAIYFFMKALANERWNSILLGSIFSVLAVLIRQPAVIVPLAFGIVFLIKNSFTKKSFFAFLPLIIVCLVLVFYEFYLKYKIGFSQDFQNKNVLFLDTLSKGLPSIAALFFRIYLKSLIYIALFALPVILLLLPSMPNIFKNRNKSWTILPLVFLSFIILYGLIKTGKVMPFGGNILYNLGLGSPTLRDIYIFGMLEHLPQFSQFFWLLITFIGVFFGLILLLFLLREIINIFRSYRAKTLSVKQLWFLFALLCLFFYMPLISVISFFDRYLIPPLLLMLIMLFIIKKDNTTPNPFLKTISIALIIIYGYVSVSLTHDYLSWNRARWNALNFLMTEKKVSAKEIDGGFEFNGWYNYDAGFAADSTKSWWWVHDDKYTVTFGELPGSKKYRSFPYQRWLPLQKDSIFILVKE